MSPTPTFNPTTAYINKISTAVPEYDMHDDFVAYADRTLDESRDQSLFRKMAERAQISHRWSSFPSIADFYGADPNSVDTKTRMREFEKNAPDLAVREIGRAHV